MIIDGRDLSVDEMFKELRGVVAHGYARRDEVSVFVNAHDREKLNLITGFVEILLECNTRIVEANGYYILKIIQEAVAQRSIIGINL
ncbi:MAG TPA: hypothetical protein DDX85_05770 [Nitrospiraceae bacterium]|nr:hypothetical protein [Nitrospiraceae bacterium]